MLYKRKEVEKNPTRQEREREREREREERRENLNILSNNAN